jgi:hypothetical protein
MTICGGSLITHKISGVSIMVKYILPLFIFLSFTTPADDTEILSVDRSVSKNINYLFLMIIISTPRKAILKS